MHLSPIELHFLATISGTYRCRLAFAIRLIRASHVGIRIVHINVDMQLIRAKGRAGNKCDRIVSVGNPSLFFALTGRS